MTREQPPAPAPTGPPGDLMARARALLATETAAAIGAAVRAALVTAFAVRPAVAPGRMPPATPFPSAPRSDRYAPGARSDREAPGDRDGPGGGDPHARAHPHPARAADGGTPPMIRVPGADGSGAGPGFWSTAAALALGVLAAALGPVGGPVAHAVRAVLVAIAGVLGGGPAPACPW